MSKRLQVILDDQEFEEIRATARQHGMTVSEWVRRMLQSARRQEATGDVERRLGAVRAAVRHQFPVADIDQMLREIEHGYHQA